jgi:hypothetical protein
MPFEAGRITKTILVSIYKLLRSRNYPIRTKRIKPAALSRLKPPTLASASQCVTMLSIF